MDEAVIDTVERFAVLAVPRPLCLPCGKAAGIVRVVLEREELGDRVGLALEGKLRRGEQFLVLLRQVVLLLEFGYDRGGERAELDLGVLKHNVAVFTGEVGAESAVEHGFRPRL